MVLYFDLKFQTEREFSEFISGTVIILIVTGLIVLTVFLFKDRYKTRQWKKGIFPATMKFSKDNLLKVYISLSASMIRRDLTDNTAKIQYMAAYFKKEFPQSDSDFKDSLHFFFKYPIQLNSVCDWVNLHLGEDIYRLQIIYFLAGMAMMNGELNTNQYRLLQHLVVLLHLNQKDFESIIAMYRRTGSKQKTSSKNRTRVRSNFSKAKSLICQQILGVTSSTSVEDIKKVYRKLVMRHHPDKFEKAGEDQVRLAKERFLKIQEAYEFLVKNHR